jgi:GlpG protein
MMIGWFFLCLTGLMGNIANAAHTAGLVIGVVWGILSSPIRKKFI